MNTKQTIGIAASCLVLGFAFGHYFRPVEVKETDKIVTTDKKQDMTVTDTKQNEHKRTVIVEEPNGKKTTTIEDVIDSDNHKTNVAIDTSKETEDKSKITINSTSKLNISLLAGVSSFLNSPTLIYGVSFSREVLGPITLGLYGFTNKSGGVSLGINL